MTLVDQPCNMTPPRWKYAPLSSDRELDCPPWADKTRNCLNSRILWRALLSLAIILVTLDVCRRYSGPWLLSIKPADDIDGIDWSQYAYCQYVTNADYLCNSVLIFEALDRLQVKASRLMMYPEQWDLQSENYTSQLLRKARDEYGVQLSPIQLQHFDGEPTWADSFTKLLAFNQTQYRRILSVDSDATVMQSMDELFFLPSSPLAMPRAYWMDDTLSSQLMLIEPSEFEFRRIQKAFGDRDISDFDMEIVNRLYNKDCMVLPHRKYDLITGEFRGNDHAKYLGSQEEIWDPQKVIDEAKFVHFSDWPFPKPWKYHSEEQVNRSQPQCRLVDSGEDCHNRRIWLQLYADFNERRERTCNVTMTQNFG